MLDAKGHEIVVGARVRMIDSGEEATVLKLLDGKRVEIATAAHKLGGLVAVRMNLEVIEGAPEKKAKAKKEAPASWQG